jgi:predicted component of type VI protein secretion system
MRARLTIDAPNGTSVHELEPDRPVTLGRSRENAIFLPDELASRVHARVHFEDGQWVLTDLDSRNGTRVNGELVDETVPLAHGQEIQIGETRMRFLVNGSGTAEIGPVTRVIEAASAGVSTTHLQTDELTTLCRFMAGAVEETEPSGLLRRALRSLLKQTGASLAGYLGLDPADPVPKLVLPLTSTSAVSLQPKFRKPANRSGSAPTGRMSRRTVCCRLPTPSACR